MCFSQTARVRAPAATLELRQPRAADGPALHDLIAACPPLDRNSRYCNLLQVTHFAATAVVAENAAGDLVGAVTGYLLPERPDVLFVWQVAVADEVRGEGLAARMFGAILERPVCSAVRWLETSITPDNSASWAAFRRFADRYAASLEQRPWFSRARHFSGAQADEMLLCIGPLGPPEGVRASA